MFPNITITPFESLTLGRRQPQTVGNILPIHEVTMLHSIWIFLIQKNSKLASLVQKLRRLSYRVNFAYCCSFIGKGLQSTGIQCLILSQLHAFLCVNVVILYMFLHSFFNQTYFIMFLHQKNM